jgi:hypothetical protein
MQMQEFQTNANSPFSQSSGCNYCQTKQLSPYYRYDRLPFKSQDAFDTKHIISHKTCYDILRCGLKLNIHLNRRDEFGAEISSQSH